jgi:anti-sigma factor RsiW
METWRLADLHAYVDDCLEPDERRAFEKQMAQDPALARRAAVWSTQNSAIRSAFDGEVARAFSISIVRHQKGSLGIGRRPASVGGKSPREQSPRPPSPAAQSVTRLATKASAPRASRTPLSLRLGLASLSVSLLCVWAPGEPAVPDRGLGEAGIAAFRTFARPDEGAVEFATGDTGETQEWLTTHLFRPVYLPLPPATVSLVGSRIAPASGAAAAFLVYKSEQRLIGLLVQSLDAPTSRAPELLLAGGRYAAVWTWGGQGFALVGDLDAPSLLKIATDFFDPPA